MCSFLQLQVCPQKIGKFLMEPSKFFFLLGSSLCEATADYGSAKAGLNHFAKHLAREEADAGVRVNTVSPGCIPIIGKDGMTYV